MKQRLAMALALAVLVVSPVAAQERSCGIDELLETLHRNSDVVHFDRDRKVDSNFLFYQLPGGSTLNEDDLLEFEILADGERLLVEKVRLAPVSAEALVTQVRPFVQERESGLSSEAREAMERPAKDTGTVVEILSREPAELARLRRMAAERDVQVLVRLNGRELARSSLLDLAAAIDARKDALPLPTPVVAEVEHGRGAVRPRQETPVPLSLQVASSCIDNCRDQLNDCTDNRCNYTWCYECQHQFDQCMEQCEGCTPSSQIVTETSLFSVVGMGDFECFLVPPSYFLSATYEWTRLRYKTTKMQITTNADCSQTTTVLQVWYTNVFCYLTYPAGCSQPIAPHGLCY